MADDDVTDVLEDIESFVKQIDVIIASEIPPNVKAAVESKWEEVVQGMEGLGLELTYGEQRRADHGRLMSLKTAIEVLRDMEDDLVDQVVQGWGKAFLGYETGVVDTIVTILQNLSEIWDAIKAANLIRYLWKSIFKLMAVSDMVRNAKICFKLQATYAARMRGKKMAQAVHARRFRKKKLTRR